MKSIYTYFITIAVLQLLITGICMAQTINLKPAPATVTIDGTAIEWGDLPYINDQAKISYAISNDKTNLYLVVKTKDAAMQADVLGSGITFSIDTKGRKRNTTAVTFPVSQNDANAFAGMNTEQLNIELAKYSKIRVEGFKNVNDGPVNVKNTYGIQVAIGHDGNGFLIYEEAIPLALFNTDVATSKEWAFNLKINGLVKREKMDQQISVVRSSVVAGPGTTYSSGSGGGMVVVSSGSSGGSAGSLGSGGIPAKVSSDAIDQINADLARRGIENYKVTQLTPSVDFWGKFNLVKGL